MKKREKGITLVALVITIIVLLILAGITITALNAENGLFTRAKQTKIQNALANAKEEVQLAISTVMTENYDSIDKINPKTIQEELNKQTNKETFVQNENEFPTIIVYPANKSGINEEIKVEIDSNLSIISVKTASGTSINNGSSGSGSNGSNTNPGGQISITEVGNVKVTITDVVSFGFTINATAESPEKIALYQYYIDGNLIYEGKEDSYKVRNLKKDTNYNVEVKVVPKSLISVSQIQQKTDEQTTIEVKEKFDKLIYIDSVSGSDTSGDGSIEKPYASLDRISNTGVITKGYSYGIILGNGNYNLTTKMCELNCDKSINIIGQKNKTVLKVTELYANNGAGSSAYTINIYRLIWNGEDHVNTIFTRTPLNFYNVVFKMNFLQASVSYFISRNKYNFYNCTITEKVGNLLRTDIGKINLTNCYGGFTSGFGTTDSSWNYQTNRIVNNYQLTEDYKITENEGLWKRVGTGQNPDQTQANLGVYGGTYSWEYNTDADLE